MIKLLYAIVAQVAMAAAQWAENVTSLAEFKLEHDWTVRQIHLPKVDARVNTRLYVLLWQVTFHTIPAACWDDTRLTRCRMHHEIVCCGQKDPEHD